MKRVLMVAVALVAVGCSAGTTSLAEEPGVKKTGNDHVYVMYDDEHEVTCWVYNNSYQGGISCLPNDQVGGPSR